MKAALILAALLALSVPARASFEDNGAGARAPGMGDAFTALADDAYAVHYNPAGLAQLERPQFGAAYSRLYTGLSDGSDIGTSNLVYAHPFDDGRKGSLGLSWERFSLSGLYVEQSLSAAYGRKVYGEPESGKLYVGGALRYLMRSFSPGSEAASACSGLNCSLGVDPALTGQTSKTAPDVDLGMIYRFKRRYQAGLSISHILAPDMAFSGGDKLQRGYNLGLAYKSLWLSLVGEVKMRRAADGKTARDLIFGAERYFPSLEHGQLGVRGSLGIGAGDWRQLTIGASYRVNKIQADYAYLVPIGGVQGHSGSHRIGLTFHFGAPTFDEELGADLLDQAKRSQGGLPKVSTGTPGFGYEYAEQARPQDLDDPRLDEVRALILQRRYRAAKQAIDALAKTQPLGPALERVSSRLGDAAYHYTELPEPKSREDKAVVESLLAFLKGQDRISLLHASYALSLTHEDPRIAALAATLENKTGLKADRLPADNPRGYIDELLWRVEFAHTRGDTPAVDRILGDVLLLDPENNTALSRLGSQRYLQGRYLEAINAWEAAAKVETRERERQALEAYLKLARDAAAAGQVSTPAQAAVVPPPAQTAVPAATPAPKRPAVTGGDPREVEGLYQKGVEYYARGEYLQASAMFLRILRIDPGNPQARKALERIDRNSPTR